MAPVAKRVKKVTTLPINVIFSHLQVRFLNIKRDTFIFILLLFRAFLYTLTFDHVPRNSKKPELKSGFTKIHA